MRNRFTLGIASLVRASPSLARAIATSWALNRLGIVFLALVLSTASSTVLLVGPAFAASYSAKAEARSVATDFFRSINERRYERTCTLLSTAYYRRNRIPSRRHCVIALRIGFMWSQEIRYRITSITATRNRAFVMALADGSPGQIVLVRERGSFKVFSLMTSPVARVS